MLTLLTSFAAFAPLSIRVEGRGFLRLDHAGRLAYVSQATITAKGGYLVTTEGDTLLPEIAIPATVKAVSVGLDGTVKFGEMELGRIVLAQLKGEQPHSTTFFSALKPTIGYPGEGLFGVVRVGKSAASVETTAPASKQISIDVRPRTDVNPGNYTLGDIAIINADNETLEKLRTLVLGPSPAIGIDRLVSGPLVSAKVRNLGLKPEQFSVNVPEGAKVSGKCQMLDSQAIIDFALKATAADVSARITFESTATPAKLVLPPGDLTTKATIENRSLTSLQVRVTVLVDGQIAGSRLVSLAPDPNTPKVRAGDTVLVRLVQNGAVIEVSARATSAALYGQTISLQTINAPVLTLNGTVTGNGTVEVRL